MKFYQFFLKKIKDFFKNAAYFNLTIESKNANSNADGYLKEMSEFHKLISLMSCGEEDFTKKHTMKRGVFKKIDFEKAEFQL